MRYLSKISIINSANINWAEVKVDGNIQLIGTQGAGKSTLLRDLVFFYTAAPGQLGINLQSQKRFIDFYFPSSHSYIIYEVARGDKDRPFSIIVSCVNRQICFRFVDSPFRQSWIIDETGIITGDQAEIRRRITKDGFEFSNNIKTYKEYKEILYGNLNGKTIQQRFLIRFNLFRNPNYEYMTRIIQNVFLNDIVEGGFVKDTIIQSISSESEQEPFVHLDVFRQHLSDFSDVSNDIRLMTSKEKQDLAKKVIYITDEIYQKQREIDDLCGNFLYLCGRYNELIPVLKEEVKKLNEEEQVINDVIKTINAEFNSEKDKKLKDIGRWETRIKDTQDKKKKYTQYDIEDLIYQVSREESIRESQRQINEVILTLEAKAVDIKVHYDNLITQRKNQNEKYILELNSEVLKEKEDLQSTITKIKDDCEKECQDIRDVMEEREKTFQNEIDNLKDLRNQLKLKHVEVNLSVPLSDEIEKIKEKLSEINSRKQLLESEEKNISLSIQKLESEMNLKEKEIEEECKPEILSVRDEIARLANEISKENALLDRYKGSFAEWLDQNVEDWQNTYGRVADEERILYNTNLSPTLNPQGSKDSFFDVNIDLSEIDYTCRRPEELKENISCLNRQISVLNNNHKKLLDEKEEKINKCHKEYAVQQKSLKEQSLQINVDLKVLPNEQSKIDLEFADVTNKSNQQRQKQLEDINRQLQEISVSEDQINSDLNKCKSEKKKQIDKIREKYQSLINRHKKESKTRVNLIDKSIKDANSQKDKEIKQLQEQKSAAMEKEGVDVKIIENYKSTLQGIESQLKNIEEYRKIVNIYQEDKREYFDKEEEFRANKKKVEESLKNLVTKYETRKKTYEDNRNNIVKEKNNKLSQINDYESGLLQAEMFRKSSQCPSNLNDHPEVHTSDNIIVTIGNLYNTIDIHKELLGSKLGKSVDAFRADFSPRNTFNLLKTDQDNRSMSNLLFAENLRELIEKGIVEEILTEKSRIYQHILGEIAREYSVLCEKESEIQKIINEVNYELAHKGFADVIRSIVMRFNKKKTQLINVLDEILQFSNDNNIYDFGSTNLFSFENEDKTGVKTQEYLQKLSDVLSNCKEDERLTLSGTFSLQVQIDENGVKTDWLDNLKSVGSNGTGILAKAIINILLMHVFKKRMGKSTDKFRLHFMMDEMGTISAENIRGLLKFANERNIYIITASPQENNPLLYRHIYHLSKNNLKTVIVPLLTTRQQTLSNENNNTTDKEIEETV